MVYVRHTSVTSPPHEGEPAGTGEEEEEEEEKKEKKKEEGREEGRREEGRKEKRKERKKERENKSTKIIGINDGKNCTK